MATADSRFDAVDNILGKKPVSNQVISNQSTSSDVDSGKVKSTEVLPSATVAASETKTLSSLVATAPVSSDVISHQITSYPWETANPKVKVAFQLRLTEPMHTKLKWLSEQKGEGSIHEIVLAAVEDKVDKLLAGYTK